MKSRSKGTFAGTVGEERRPEPAVSGNFGLPGTVCSHLRQAGGFRNPS